MANPFEVQVPNALQSLMLGDQSYQTARADARQREISTARELAAQDFRSGNTQGAIGRLIAIDPQGASMIANMGHNDRDFAFKQQEALRAQGNTNRSFELQNKQAEEKPQYMKDDAGNIVEIQPYGKGSRVINPTGAPASNNPYATPGKPMQEHEAKAGLFADRMASAHETLNKHQDINKGAGGFIGGVLSNNLPEGITVASPATSDARVSVLNAQRSFINSLLRRESGAAIASSEFASYGKEYFPQPGDTQEVLDSKRRHRAEVIAGLAREAGTKYTPRFSLDAEGNISQTPIRAVTAKGGAQPAVLPKIGESRDGYRYKGGNPADQASWVKIQ